MPLASVYYDKNSWLHVEKSFTHPWDMIDFLVENKPEKPGLSFLTQALWLGGKIPKDKLEYFQRSAGAADYYYKNPWLHTEHQFADPYDVVQFLRKNRRGKKRLDYLATALWAGGRIPWDKEEEFRLVPRQLNFTTLCRFASLSI